MPVIERPMWRCPECGERHYRHDGECTHECCVALAPVLEAAPESWVCYHGGAQRQPAVIKGRGECHACGARPGGTDA